MKGSLLDYTVRSVTEGKDALGEVSILVRFGKDAISGRAASTDVIEASAKAYVNAINKIAHRKKKK